MGFDKDKLERALQEVELNLYGDSPVLKRCKQMYSAFERTLETCWEQEEDVGCTFEEYVANLLTIDSKHAQIVRDFPIYYPACVG